VLSNNPEGFGLSYQTVNLSSADGEVEIKEIEGAYKYIITLNYSVISSRCTI
jgi:hypothetical protein